MVGVRSVRRVVRRGGVGGVGPAEQRVAFSREDLALKRDSLVEGHRLRVRGGACADVVAVDDAVVLRLPAGGQLILGAVDAAEGVGAADEGGGVALGLLEGPAGEVVAGMDGRVDGLGRVVSLREVTRVGMFGVAVVPRGVAVESAVVEIDVQRGGVDRPHGLIHRVADRRVGAHVVAELVDDVGGVLPPGQGVAFVGVRERGGGAQRDVFGAEYHVVGIRHGVVFIDDVIGVGLPGRGEGIPGAGLGAVGVGHGLVRALGDGAVRAVGEDPAEEGVAGLGGLAEGLRVGVDAGDLLPVGVAGKRAAAEHQDKGAGVGLSRGEGEHGVGGEAAHGVAQTIGTLDDRDAGVGGQQIAFGQMVARVDREADGVGAGVRDGLRALGHGIERQGGARVVHEGDGVGVLARVADGDFHVAGGGGGHVDGDRVAALRKRCCAVFNGDGEIRDRGLRVARVERERERAVHGGEIHDILSRAVADREAGAGADQDCLIGLRLRRDGERDVGLHGGGDGERVFVGVADLGHGERSGVGIGGDAGGVEVIALFHGHADRDVRVAVFRGGGRRGADEGVIALDHAQIHVEQIAAGDGDHVVVAHAGHGDGHHVAGDRGGEGDAAGHVHGHVVNVVARVGGDGEGVGIVVILAAERAERVVVRDGAGYGVDVLLPLREELDVGDPGEGRVVSSPRAVLIAVIGAAFGERVAEEVVADLDGRGDRGEVLAVGGGHLLRADLGDGGPGFGTRGLGEGHGVGLRRPRRDVGVRAGAVAEGVGVARKAAVGGGVVFIRLPAREVVTRAGGLGHGVGRAGVARFAYLQDRIVFAVHTEGALVRVHLELHGVAVDHGVLQGDGDVAGHVFDHVAPALGRLHALVRAGGRDAHEHGRGFGIGGRQRDAERDVFAVGDGGLDLGSVVAVDGGVEAAVLMHQRDGVGVLFRLAERDGDVALVEAGDGERDHVAVLHAGHGGGARGHGGIQIRHGGVGVAVSQRDLVRHGILIVDRLDERGGRDGVAVLIAGLGRKGDREVLDLPFGVEVHGGAVDAREVHHVLPGRVRRAVEAVRLVVGRPPADDLVARAGEQVFRGEGDIFVVNVVREQLVGGLAVVGLIVDVVVMRVPHAVHVVGRDGARVAEGIDVAADRAGGGIGVDLPVVEGVAGAGLGIELHRVAGVAGRDFDQLVREHAVQLILEDVDLRGVALPHGVEVDRVRLRGALVGNLFFIQRVRLCSRQRGGEVVGLRAALGLGPADQRVTGLREQRAVIERQLRVVDAAGLRVGRRALAVVHDGEDVGVPLRGQRIGGIALGLLADGAVDVLPGGFGEGTVMDARVIPAVEGIARAGRIGDGVFEAVFVLNGGLVRAAVPRAAVRIDLQFGAVDLPHRVQGCVGVRVRAAEDVDVDRRAERVGNRAVVCVGQARSPALEGVADLREVGRAVMVLGLVVRAGDGLVFGRVRGGTVLIGDGIGLVFVLRLKGILEAVILREGIGRAVEAAVRRADSRPAREHHAGGRGGRRDRIGRAGILRDIGRGDAAAAVQVEMQGGGVARPLGDQRLAGVEVRVGDEVEVIGVDDGVVGVGIVRAVGPAGEGPAREGRDRAADGGGGHAPGLGDAAGHVVHGAARDGRVAVEVDAVLDRGPGRPQGIGFVRGVAEGVGGALRFIIGQRAVVRSALPDPLDELVASLGVDGDVEGLAGLVGLVEDHGAVRFVLHDHGGLVLLPHGVQIHGVRLGGGHVGDLRLIQGVRLGDRQFGGEVVVLRAALGLGPADERPAGLRDGSAGVERKLGVVFAAVLRVNIRAFAVINHAIAVGVPLRDQFVGGVAGVRHADGAVHVFSGGGVEAAVVDTGRIPAREGIARAGRVGDGDLGIVFVLEGGLGRAAVPRAAVRIDRQFGAVDFPDRVQGGIGVRVFAAERGGIDGRAEGIGDRGAADGGSPALEGVAGVRRESRGGQVAEPRAEVVARDGLILGRIRVLAVLIGDGEGLVAVFRLHGVVRRVGGREGVAHAVRRERAVERADRFPLDEHHAGGRGGRGQADRFAGEPVDRVRAGVGAAVEIERQVGGVALPDRVQGDVLRDVLHSGIELVRQVRLVAEFGGGRAGVSAPAEEGVTQRGVVVGVQGISDVVGHVLVGIRSAHGDAVGCVLIEGDGVGVRLPLGFERHVAVFAGERGAAGVGGVHGPGGRRIGRRGLPVQEVIADLGRGLERIRGIGSIVLRARGGFAGGDGIGIGDRVGNRRPLGGQRHVAVFAGERGIAAVGAAVVPRGGRGRVGGFPAAEGIARAFGRAERAFAHDRIGLLRGGAVVDEGDRVFDRRPLRGEGHVAVFACGYARHGLVVNEV